MKNYFRSSLFLCALSIVTFLFTNQSQALAHQFVQLADTASNVIVLNSGWLAQRAEDIPLDGSVISSPGFQPYGWLKAVVPGTILSTLVKDGIYPDPYYGLNNEKIPDIYHTGRAFYTYWFYKTFRIKKTHVHQHVWLNFRGINYSANIFLNGHRVNEDVVRGMFLRHSFDITKWVKYDSLNRLAVIVHPPDPVGNPNGGQGGDGVIAKSVTNQFVAGWDWMMPIHDRNTGIWDKVSLKLTGPVIIKYPFVRPKVPGIRKPGEKQRPAYILVTSEVRNATDKTQSGFLAFDVAGKSTRKYVKLAPHQKIKVSFREMKIDHPKLWWPNGYGAHPIYSLHMYFESRKHEISDTKTVHFGIRQITSYMDPKTHGRIFEVNGQKIFIRGGDWIVSDAMLRLSRKRYDEEVRMHAEMNLNMIRVWGGGITERPAFYDACDKYGILVMQDLWITGDCNGAWVDPMKKDSRERRREYPNNHTLFLKSVVDQVRMLRNHPSLCFWSGGNEFPAPKDILDKLEKNIMPKLDPDRLFVPYSTSKVLYVNPYHSNGDGPYGIQIPKVFFTHRSYPFNPEVGSVGMPVAATMKRMMPKSDLSLPSRGHWNVDWRYHKYIPYTDSAGVNHIDLYGKPKNIDQFCYQAQLVNYKQYKSLIEGWNAHMWKWYTGVLIWKTQNPWTALRGQMYDWYLDQDGGFYGLRHAAEHIHVQYDLATHKVQVVNNSVFKLRDVHVRAELYDLSGQKYPAGQQATDVAANSVQNLFTINTPGEISKVYFLRLLLTKSDGKVLSDNFYWLRKPGNDYRSLHKLNPANVETTAKSYVKNGRYYINVRLKNVEKSGEPVAFWLKLQTYHKESGRRILPSYYTDNYFSLVPGQSKVITIDFSKSALKPGEKPELKLTGWNVAARDIKFTQE